MSDATTSYRTPIHRLMVVKEGSIRQRPRITSSTVAKTFVKSIFDQRGYTKEVVLVIPLDTKHRPIHIEEVTVGTLDSSLVHPREVFRFAIHHGAQAVLIAHNHPSGDPTPSREDRDVTSRLRDAGRIVGITVLDHIVGGDEECVSIMDEGLGD